MYLKIPLHRKSVWYHYHIYFILTELGALERAPIPDMKGWRSKSGEAEDHRYRCDSNSSDYCDSINNVNDIETDEDDDYDNDVDYYGGVDKVAYLWLFFHQGKGG